MEKKREPAHSFVLLMCLLVMAGCGDGGFSSHGVKSLGEANNPKFWGVAELVENTDVNSAWRPQVAMSSDGNALAVWDQSNGTNHDIRANRFDGTSWGMAVLLENDSGHARDPQIVMSSDGSALAVWEQDDGTWDSIWSSRFDGSSWSMPELLETGNAGHADDPQIAISPDGSALAVWDQSDGTYRNIYFNRFDGSRWGVAELVETSNDRYASDPQIAMSPDGVAVAVWEQYDGTRDNIWANRFNGSSWGVAELIERNDVGFARRPQVALSSGGSAIVVWDQSDGIRNIWSNRYDGSAWGTARLLENNDGNAGDPQVAMSSDGSAIAVWRQWDGTRGNIWSKGFDGTAWGPAELIESETTGSSYLPIIRISADGSALVVWEEDDRTRFNVWANCFDGVNWGTAELLETGARHARYPQLAMSPDGRATAIWHQWDGHRYNIWANRYE